MIRFLIERQRHLLQELRFSIPGSDSRTACPRWRRIRYPKQSRETSLLQALLPLPRIPVQSLRDAVHPVIPASRLGKDVGKRVSGCRHRHVVAGVQFNPVHISNIPVVRGSCPHLCRPSKLAHELVRASYGTPIRRTIVSGRMMGRKDRVCAQMAVTRITGLSGWHREPPAAKLYAVEPVGVAMQTPSARRVVKCSSSPNNSIEDIAVHNISLIYAPAERDLHILGFGPRSRTTSFRI